MMLGQIAIRVRTPQFVVPLPTAGESKQAKINVNTSGGKITNIILKMYANPNSKKGGMN